MPKNKGKGGKNRRRGKNENENQKREIRLPEYGEVVGKVLKLLGNCRAELECYDNAPAMKDLEKAPRSDRRRDDDDSDYDDEDDEDESESEDERPAARAADAGPGAIKRGDKVIRHGRIRGKMRKKVWITQYDMVLVSLRDFGLDNKADIVAKYSPDEEKHLRKLGFIPTETKEEGGPDFDNDIAFDNEDSDEEAAFERTKKKSGGVYFEDQIEDEPELTAKDATDDFIDDL